MGLNLSKRMAIIRPLSKNKPASNVYDKIIRHRATLAISCPSGFFSDIDFHIKVSPSFNFILGQIM